MPRKELTGNAMGAWMRTKPLFLQRCLEYRRNGIKMEEEEKHGWDRIRLDVQETANEPPGCLFVSSGTSENVGGVHFFNPAHAQLVRIDRKGKSQAVIEVKLRIYSNGKGVAEDGILFLVRAAHPDCEFAKDRVSLTISARSKSAFGYIGHGEPVLFSWISRGSLARSISSASPLELSFLAARLLKGVQDQAGGSGAFTLQTSGDNQSRLKIVAMPHFMPTFRYPALKRNGSSTSSAVYFRYLYDKLSQCRMDLVADCRCPFCGLVCREYRVLKNHLKHCHDLFVYGFSEPGTRTPTINVSAKPPVYTNGKLGFCLNRDGSMDFLWASNRWTSPAGHFHEADIGNFTPAHRAENGKVCEASTPSRTTEEKPCQLQTSPVDVSEQTPLQDVDQLIVSEKAQAQQQIHKLDKQNQRGGRIRQSLKSEESGRDEKGKGPATEPYHTAQPIAGRKRKVGGPEAKKRMFYHSKTCQLITEEELANGCPDSDDEEDFEVWLESERKSLDEFIDVNETEKQFMHLWNAYVHLFPVYGDIQIPPACKNFAKEHQQKLSEDEDLRQCFVLFLIHLFQIGLIDQEVIVSSLDAADGVK